MPLDARLITVTAARPVFIMNGSCHMCGELQYVAACCSALQCDVPLHACLITVTVARPMFTTNGSCHR